MIGFRETFPDLRVDINAVHVSDDGSVVIVRTTFTGTQEGSFLDVPATAAVLLLGLPLWVMFVGWISYYTRGVTVRDGLLNYLGVIIGLLLGLGAALVVQALGSPPTFFKQVAVIFGVALVVLSLRFLPKVNNLLTFFLGLVTVFAACAEPTFVAVLPLAGAAAIGAIASAVAHSLQLRLAQQPEEEATACAATASAPEQRS